jgi:hypothetical protein
MVLPDPAALRASNLARGCSGTTFARTLLAVEAAGKNPRSFADADLVAKTQADVHDRGADGVRLERT